MTASKSSEKQVRLGVSPLSWTNDVLKDLGGDIPLEVCLKDAAEIGYEGMELGRKFPKDPKELSAKLSEIRASIGRWLVLRVPRRPVAGGRMGGRFRPCPIVRGMRMSRACLWRVWKDAGRFPFGPAAEPKPWFEIS